MKKLIASIIIIIIVASIGIFLILPDKIPRGENGTDQIILLDGAWILEYGSGANVRIIDMRSEDEYERGHIEYALRLDPGSIRETVNGVVGMVPSKEVIESVMGELGVSSNDKVVIYDKGDSLDSARLFWTLEYYGHAEVMILDGGWNKWVNDGNPISTESYSIEKTTYIGKLRPELLATADYVLEKMDNPKTIILDVRSRLEFEGGHIPGSVNLEWNKVLNSDYTFKSKNDLSQLFEDIGITGTKEVVTLCQSGSRASHGYFTMRLLGYTVRLYDGSWQEWSSRNDLPIETTKKQYDAKFLINYASIYRINESYESSTSKTEQGFISHLM